MKRRLHQIILVVLTSCILTLFVVVLIIHTTKSTSSDKFLEMVQYINNTFKFTGYEEIMNETTHILALPQNYELINDNDEILGRQKLFVFKSVNTDAIIMLQVTQSESINNEWNSSLNYSSELFNSKNSKFGDFFNEHIPDVEFAFNAFTYNGCHYSTICISGKHDIDYAATELIRFSNELINFIAIDFENGGYKS